MNKYPKEVVARVIDLHEQGWNIANIKAELGPNGPCSATISAWIDRGLESASRINRREPWEMGQAIANVKIRGSSVREVARHLEVSPTLLRQWIRKHFDADTMAEMSFEQCASVIMEDVTQRRNQRGNRIRSATKKHAQQRDQFCPPPIFESPVDDPQQQADEVDEPTPETTVPAAEVDEPAPETKASAGEDGVMFNGRTVARPLSADELPDDIDELKRMLTEERFYRAAAESAVVVLGKGLDSVDNRAKTRMAQKLHKGGFRLCQAQAYYEIKKATYHRHIALMSLPDIDKLAAVRTAMTQICNDAKQALRVKRNVLGYRCVYAALKQRGFTTGEKTVRALMHEQGLSVNQRGRYTYSSYAGELTDAPANLLMVDDTGAIAAHHGPSTYFQAHNHTHPGQQLAHDFHADRPFERLVTDLSEIRCSDGKIYISPMVDLYDGCILSCTVGFRPASALVQVMLGDVLAQIPESVVPTIHTDRGMHYRTNAWINASTTKGGTVRFYRSMSRKGKSGDNAAAEGIFGLMKTELGFIHDATHTMTRAEVLSRLDAWIDWYHHKRLHSRLGYTTIAKHRGWEQQDTYQLTA